MPATDIEEIIEQAETEKRRLNKIEEAIDLKIRAINRKPRPRPQADENEKDELNNDLDAVRVAARRLALRTAGKIDKSETATRLAKSIRAVRKRLDRRRERLLKLGAVASDIGNILGKIEDVAGNLDKFKGRRGRANA